MGFEIGSLKNDHLQRFYSEVILEFLCVKQATLLQMQFYLQ